MAVAPVAIPPSFVLSAPDMRPDALVVASAWVCDAAALPSSAACCAVLTGLLASDVLSTLPRPTTALLSVCHVLSPRQYWPVLPAMMVGSPPPAACCAAAWASSLACSAALALALASPA